MTPEQRIAAIAERERKATKGPWRFMRVNKPRRGEQYPSEVLNTTAVAATYAGHQVRTEHSGGVSPTFDGEFIAAARQDVPYLLSALAAAQQENARLTAKIDELLECASIFCPYEKRMLAAEAQRDALRAALTQLHALVCGECPSLLNEDSGGDARLAMQIEATLAALPAGTD